MNQEQTPLLKGLAIGAGIGLATGIAASIWYQKKKHLAADDVLAKIKKAFLKEGSIEGSFIEYESKPYQKFAIKVDSYAGGITRFEDDQLVSYEFLADAKTGTVLEIKREVTEVSPDILVGF